KGETAESTIKGLCKAQDAGIETSVMLINGLGGKKYSQQHALNSAKVVNAIKPKYLATLVLSFPLGKDMYLRKFKGEYEDMTKKDLFIEMRDFLSNLKLENTVFRSDHASNYLMLRGTLNRDKQKLITLVEQMIDKPDSPELRPEWMRGL
ncbi:MAG: radical SAM protein, partial [Planctomycetes bacterium]|nr:radical SAM protein [Planctomycetota bacterium]